MTSQMVTIHTPGLPWFLNRLETDFHPIYSVDLYVHVLKRRTVRNPTPTAVATAQLFLRLIASHKWHSLRTLMDYVVSLETRLSAARPRELSVRNIARRVIGIIKEEAENNSMGDAFKAAVEAGETVTHATKHNRPPLLTSHMSFANSAFDLLSRSTSAASTPIDSPAGTHTPTAAGQKDIRPPVLQDIQDLIEEIEGATNSIADFALSVVHKNEVLLTYGLAPAVHRLLLRASQKRNFTVVVVEGAPPHFIKTHGAAMNKLSVPENDLEEDEPAAAARKSLQDRAIKVVVITDADVHNIISRVNKVILDANYVLADGALVAPAGTMNVMRAAKRAMKPVVVLAGTHTLCPVTNLDGDHLVEMGPPVAIGYNEGFLVAKANLPSPMTDFVPRGYVDMFVTNNGIVSPTTIDRATLDLYHMPEADMI